MDIFIMTDQPVTCPRCGARAEIIHEFKVDDLFSHYVNAQIRIANIYS